MDILSLLTIAGIIIAPSRGAPGCIDLKRELSDLSQFKITRKPMSASKSDGTCGLEKTCCSGEVEEYIKGGAMGELKGILANEVVSVKSMLNTIKSMTGSQMETMMEELIPAEIAANLDIGGIAAAVWQYSLGEITSYNLTIEVAVIGSKMLFTERAERELIEMTECVIRELGRTATAAFEQIAAIVEDQLEAPRTFGKGFQVADTLFNTMQTIELAPDCSYDKLMGCPKCGVRTPGPCRSTCLATSNSCMSNSFRLTSLWPRWVDSLSKLIDAMMLMKEIKVDPQEIVTPELMEEIQTKIVSSLVNADLNQCRQKRSVPSFEGLSADHKELVDSLRRTKRSEGQMLATLLSGFFENDSLNQRACRSAKSDERCWLGDHVGDFVQTPEATTAERATKSYGSNTHIAEAAIDNYAILVDSVVGKITTKVRAQRSSYQQYNKGRRQRP